MLLWAFWSYRPGINVDISRISACYWSLSWCCCHLVVIYRPLFFVSGAWFHSSANISAQRMSWIHLFVGWYLSLLAYFWESYFWYSLFVVILLVLHLISSVVVVVIFVGDHYLSIVFVVVFIYFVIRDAYLILFIFWSWYISHSWYSSWSLNPSACG